MSDRDHQVEAQANVAVPCNPTVPKLVPVRPAGRRQDPLPVSEARPAKPLFRALASMATTLRRFMAAATLSVPLAYFVAFLMTGGVLRSELASGLVGVFLRAVISPGLWLFDHIFARRVVDNGWNFELVIVGALLFIPRHFLMLPFEHLDHWAADVRTRSAYGNTMVAIHPGASFVPKPVARQTLPPNSALEKA